MVDIESKKIAIAAVVICLSDINYKFMPVKPTV